MFRSSTFLKANLKNVRFNSSLPLSVKLNLPNGISYEQPTGLFINNEWVKPLRGETLEVTSPSTEEVITKVYQGLEDDVDVAVAAAKNAFETTSWATGDPTARVRALLKLADLYEEHAETLASIEVLDNGKCIANARGDVALSANYLRSAAGFADKMHGEFIETGNTHLNYTRKEAIGVVGAIVAWNFPLMLLSWKLGPALAAGNTMVIKSAEATPLSALFVANLIKEAGFPAGVVNFVTGLGPTVGERISTHPDIGKITFTGSTLVGKRIMRNASETVKKVTLELGGKSANIVFPDADIDRAVENIYPSIFYNTGEVCSAGSRLYVHEDIYDGFISRLLEKVKTIKMGNPFDESVVMGAQNSVAQFKKILKYIEIGNAEGAKLLTGGKRHGNKGYFVEPTIFTDVKPNMRIVQEEIFGPVLAVSKFSSTDEVIKAANDSTYGLASGIHTSNINTIAKVSSQLKAGTVFVNTYNDFNPAVPFGGFKQSGFGKEMGKDALDSYIQIKAVRAGIY
ncbi:potassium-activated aldehyde dehydrogenase, mitochondrial [[Candida] jaroonii]|uniref:Potassium-activated aldehyde dehydrogenase, mitochondrial n=1 Tax=[Candida] jaroonii TaxID=467808 RepID=A0ACA9YAS9_9ASCO|nr:potassium-activated aldehyde dehydrogenase, mitochondrial [[Candida] jaroonii]